MKFIYNNPISYISLGLVAQIFLIISVPILAKFYDPESFGRFNYITSLSVLLSSVLCLGLQKSLLTFKQNTDLDKYLNYALIIIIINTLIASIFINIWSFQFDYILLCLLAFLTAFNELFKFYFLALSKLNPILVTKYTSSIVSPLSKVIFSFSIFKAKGLLLGQVFEKFFTSFVNIYYSAFRFKKSRFSEVFRFAKSKAQFIRYSLPSTLLNITSSHLLVYFLPFFFSFELLGYYFLATKILSIPTSSLGSLISELFTSRYISSNNKKELFVNTVMKLFLISIPIFLGVYLMCDFLVYIFFEEKWSYTSELIKILIPLHFFRFLSSPCSYIFEMENKNHLLFKFNIYYLAFNLTSISLLKILSLNIEDFLFIYSIIGSFIYIRLLFLSKKAI